MSLRMWCFGERISYPSAQYRLGVLSEPVRATHTAKGKCPIHRTFEQPGRLHTLWCGQSGKQRIVDPAYRAFLPRRAAPGRARPEPTRKTETPRRLHRRTNRASGMLHSVAMLLKSDGGGAHARCRADYRGRTFSQTKPLQLLTHGAGVDRAQPPTKTTQPGLSPEVTVAMNG